MWNRQPDRQSFTPLRLFNNEVANCTVEVIETQFNSADMYTE